MAQQLFVPTYRIDECLKEIRECLELGWTGLGYKTVEFEEAWKGYTGYDNAHFLNSATAGLHLAVKILKDRLNWREGDEVISTPLTFISTNHAILYEGLNVVFADVDEYLCLDPTDVKKKITPKTRAILFVGFAGNSGQYDKIKRICQENQLALIVDAAHMAGTSIDGKRHISGADAAIYSFQAVKNLPTADSGMICFANHQDDARARKLSWLGISKDTYSRTNSKSVYKWRYDVEDVGYKYHGNSVMAAIGLVQLRYLDEDNEYRRKLCRLYEKLLRSIDSVDTIRVPDQCISSSHIFPILTDQRDELMFALNGAGIFPGVHYQDNTLYPMYSYAKGTCPKASSCSNRIVSLPLHLRLEVSDIKYIVHIIDKFFGG